ncbi:acyltransferase family protein [Asaia prunellae]|uniref:acyltransferase family protein n=1 Tax=Asaia prunellae TaxID=610245 RepID=UPI00046F597C|nr:acyltransferase [Asaia prunellae]
MVNTLDSEGATVSSFDMGRSEPVPDRTETGKEHFEVLDGLRGTAAILVVLFHIQGITVTWVGEKVILHHAPLAVDFFFALSGFVMGYAYDDRWKKMSVGQFLTLRLIRLHPLVILGVTMGLVSYLFDPFKGSLQNVPLETLLGVFVLGLLLLPAGPLPNRWTDTHPFNGPCWSLLQEYIGNIAYALVLRHLSARVLGGIAIVAGIVLTACALSIGTLDQGSSFETLWMAQIRLYFPFVTGLWLYRLRDRLPRFRLGWLPLSVIMTAAMLVPIIPESDGVKWNGFYEALCVILLFPAIIIAGQHSNAGRGMLGLCKASGRISYPLYITHFPILYVWMNYVANCHPTSRQLLAYGLATIPVTLLVAWAGLVFWDEPIRSRLRSAMRARR